MTPQCPAQRTELGALAIVEHYSPADPGKALLIVLVLAVGQRHTVVL